MKRTIPQIINIFQYSFQIKIKEHIFYGEKSKNSLPEHQNLNSNSITQKNINKY